VKRPPRIVVIAACLACASVALLACSVSPRDSTPTAAAYQASPETWREVYETIFAASVAAGGEAEAYARTAMEEWIDEVRQRTESDFVPWYCGYWTQQWLGLKAGWYAANRSEGRATTAAQLAAYLQAQYDARVLEPVRRETDPDEIMDDATAAYVLALRDELQGLPERFHVSPDELDERLDRIPAIVPTRDPRQGVSLHQLMAAGDITQVPAYLALVAPVRAAGGAISLQPLRDGLESVAAGIADGSLGKLAARGTATAASAALGPPGILLGAGITAWGAIEHSRDRPALEAELRQVLDAGLDAVWTAALANLDSTVLAPVRHISSTIDVSLFGLQSGYGALPRRGVRSTSRMGARGLEAGCPPGCRGS
jgi:hypothetical protein